MATNLAQLQPGDDALFFSMASASPFDSSEDPNDGKNKMIGGDEQTLPQYQNRGTETRMGPHPPRPRFGPSSPIPVIRFTPGAHTIP